MIGVVLISLVLSTGALSQTKEFTLKIDVPVVSVDVSVVDKLGRPVDGLLPEDFEIHENGVRQNILYFGSSNAPYNVYLLFDSSGSTEHKWHFMQRAIEGFIEHIKAQDRISIGLFDEVLTTLAGWDEPKKQSINTLRPFIENKQSGGTTEFYNALEHVLTKSLRGIVERRAVVVLTDGRDTSLYRDTIKNNRVKPAEKDRNFLKLLKTAQKRGIPIYVIATNTDRNLESNPSGADEYRNLQVLYGNSDLPEQYLTQVRMRIENLADVSGGQTLFPDGLDDVVPLFEQIGKDLGSAYSLGYVPSGLKSKGLRTIVVRVENKTYRVQQSRSGYYSN